MIPDSSSAEDAARRSFVEQRMRTAIHESAHALVAYVTGIPFTNVSIVRDAGSFGRIVVGAPRPASEVPRTARRGLYHVTRGEMELHIMQTVAGAVAETMLCPGFQLRDVLVAGDAADARQYALALWPHPDVADAYVLFTCARVKAVLGEPVAWDALTRLAFELCERHEMSGDEVMRLLREAGLQLPKRPRLAGARRASASRTSP